jgi:hypothetical protein
MRDRVWIPFPLRLGDLHQDYLVFSCETQVDSNSVADPDPGWTSHHHFSESLETVFRVFDPESF